MAVIDDIKARLDILDVVSGYVSLQRSGRAFKACCPFHQERTPSFYVNQERQSWHCFGACATGGDIFGFIMKAENLEFREALQRLAQQAGVALPTRERQSEHEDLFRLNEVAREFFQQYLASSMGSDARAYVEGRGINKETVSKFELGLSPRDGQGLFNHLLKSGFTPEMTVRAGASYQRQDGGHVDAFRGRLIIPIRNGQGELAGFGSRALDDSMPKYLNTGRTPVFDKGRTLYGMYLARDSARQQGIVIVEGYMDAISAHQHGYDNVVASMGTALTEYQVAEVLRTTRQVTMALDADAAGQQATLRSLESSWQVFQNRQVWQSGGASSPQRQEDLNLRVAILTDGKDPDEVIRQSPEKWEELVSNGVPLFDYLLPALSAQVNTSTPEGKVRMVERVSPFIYAVNEPILQDSYLRKLADFLAVRDETLRATLNRPNMRQADSRSANGARGNGARANSAGPGERPSNRNGVDRSALLAEERDSLDERCLTLLLQFPDLAEDLPELGGLPPEYFRRPENREIYVQLTRAWTEAPEMLMPDNSLSEQTKRYLLPELGEHVERLASRKLPPMEPWVRKDEFHQVLARMEERQLKELKAAEQIRFSGDLTEIPEEATEETLNLNRKIKENQDSREQYSQKVLRGR
ncbi:MAG: DNA primase [Chloroflexi bacterium]|nr:DNA primase [Chloroflexota bacterium]